MSESNGDKSSEVNVEIVSIYPILSMKPDEFGKKYYVIIARTDKGDMVSVKIPENEYSKELLMKLIKEELEKLRAIKGEKITIKL